MKKNENPKKVLNCGGSKVPTEAPKPPTEAPKPTEAPISIEFEQEEDIVLSDSDFVVEAGSYELSNVCNPDYVDQWGRDCDDWKPWCNWWEDGSFIFFGMESQNGLVTALNCPQCGCNGTPIELGKQDEGRSVSENDISPQSRQ